MSQSTNSSSGELSQFGKGTGATPIFASTMILMTQEEMPRLLLLKRSDTVRFMPGALVFPGGRVDLEDRTKAQALIQTKPEWLDHWNKSAHWHRWGFESADEPLAHVLAALRELKEEAGISLDDHVLIQMTSVGRWVTPPVLPRRYDTTFWALSIAEPRTVQVDGSEITESYWWTAQEVIQAYQNGTIDLAVPTFRILSHLAEFNDQSPIEAMFDLQSIPIICPRPIKIGNRLNMLLPGDVRYNGDDDASGARHTIWREGTGRWQLLHDQ